METNLNFYIAIMCITGILQIILFFKLWKMTNDVRKIKEEKKGRLKKEAIIKYLGGDFSGAKKDLDSAFFNELINALFGEWHAYSERYLLIKKEYASLYEKMGLDAPDFEKYMDSDIIPKP